MPFKFNPFTGNFDQKGSGGGASYIDGEEAVYGDLSLDAGVAPLNSAWLVRSSSGIWPFNKPGGIYIRTATGGVSRDADYTYAGTMPDVFSDAVLTIYDEASTTRTGQFNLGSVTAGQNRVLTWPDASGTIARTEDFASPPAIGNTTPAAGSFTTLSASTSLTLGTSGILSGGTNTIEQRNTTSGQTFRIYNTVSGTNDANFERGFIGWSSNTLRIGTEAGGSGVARSLAFLPNGTNVATWGTGEVNFASAYKLTFNNRLVLNTAADGNFRLTNWAENGFGLLQFGGTTSSFPALKRSSTALQVRLANDSDFTAIQGKLTTETAYTAGAPTATGYLVLYDSNGTAYKVPAEAL